MTICVSTHPKLKLKQLPYQVEHFPFTSMFGVIISISMISEKR